MPAKSWLAVQSCQLRGSQRVRSPGPAAKSSRRVLLWRVFQCPKSLPACHRAREDSQLGRGRNLCRHIHWSRQNKAAPNQDRCWWDVALAKCWTAIPAKLAPRIGDVMWSPSVVLGLWMMPRLLLGGLARASRRPGNPSLRWMGPLLQRAQRSHQQLHSGASVEHGKVQTQLRQLLVPLAAQARRPRHQQLRLRLTRRQALHVQRQ
mmetsp:Transcript_46388/g.92022  ORF Transcript_46388/g.92022 Transcript_46388/m.92022 type:complete len:206 (+) Transcript_46388:1047-1664(+)